MKYMNILVIYCICYALQFNLIKALIPRPTICKTQPQDLCTLTDHIEYYPIYEHCPILDNAVRKFYQRILNELYPLTMDSEQQNVSCAIGKLAINIKQNCDETVEELWPSEMMDESYSIKISDNQIRIDALEIWGALYALETVAQLAYKTEYTRVIFQTEIADQPRFKYRGYLIDTSRHYLSLNEIKRFMDAMAMTKLNVLHWHMTDDPSFPFVSSKFPLLSEKGAFDPYRLIYTQQDVQDVLRYARFLGIRVMPEFDTPGHTLSWGKGYPQLLTKCNGHNYGHKYGPVNPVLNSTYSFMAQFFSEVMTVFPETLLHLGGDEVEFECWKTDEDILKFMNKMGFKDDFKKLEGYYIARLIEVIRSIKPKSRKFTPIVWQEIFDDGFRGDNSTIIHIWKLDDWQSVANRSTAAGYHILLSAFWYLNVIYYGDDWKVYYSYDIQDFGGTPEQAKLVLGGEATMWGEYVDDTNLFSRSWPRGAAVAERLWSIGKFDTHEFSPRLDELRCRMLKRGWRAEPVIRSTQCPP